MVMGIFTRRPMGSTVLDLVPSYSTKGVPVEVALSSDVLTISCGVSKGAPLSSSLPQISVHRIMGFQQITVAGAIFPRNTLRCLRQRLLKLQREKQTLCRFSIRGMTYQTIYVWQVLIKFSYICIKGIIVCANIV